MSIQRPTLGRIWSSSGDRFDPGAEKYAQGWTAEIPTYEVLNFLQHKTDCTLLATAQRGVPEWGSDVTYEKGAVAWDNLNNTIYCAMVPAPNNSLAPSKNPSQWEISSLQFTASTHMALSKKIDDHIADKVNPHKVTTEQVGTYNKPTIDDKINKVSGDTSNHANDKSNPHKVTAAQAGGVPITGGRYTGPVGFNSNEVKINAQSGDHSVLAETDRLSLRNKTAKLSIHADGSATANGVKLVNEQQYPAVRARDEHLYAVPVPDLYLDLLNDIHIKQGVGFSELIRGVSASYVDKTGTSRTAQAGEPRHEASGLLLDSRTHQEYLEIAAENFKGQKVRTFFLEFVQGTKAGLTHYLTHGSFGIYSVDGQLRVGQDGHATPALVGPTLITGTKYRVAVTVESNNNVSLFVDGVLFTNKTWVYDPSTTSTGKLGVSGHYWIRDLRAWNSVLTAEQISTL